jgi:hypothetical protein
MVIKIQRSRGKYGEAFKKGFIEYDILQILDISDEAIIRSILIPKEEIIQIIKEIQEKFPELFKEEVD